MEEAKPVRDEKGSEPATEAKRSSRSRSPKPSRRSRSRERDRDRKRSRSRDRDRRQRSRSAERRRDSGRKRSRSRSRDRARDRRRSRSRERRRSPTPEKVEAEVESEDDTSSESVLSSWLRKYAPKKNDPPIKLKGSTLLELIQNAIAKNIKGKYGAWHEYLQYLHRHGKGARPAPGKDPVSHSKRTQTNFLKSLRRCDRKGDVAIVLEVEKQLLRELNVGKDIANNAVRTMPNSFINLPFAIPAGANSIADPRTGLPVNLPPTHASLPVSAQQSQRELAAKFGLNESALEALKDPAVRAALDPAVLAQLAPVLATLQ